MGCTGGGTAVIIPARLLATRFPAKLLHEVAGRCVLEWTWRRAREATGPSSVFIATDSPEVSQVASSFGARIVHTGPCASGTDRVAAAASQLFPRPAAVINLQGDEPLVDPSIIDLTCNALRTRTDEIVTCGTRFPSETEWRDRSIVKVVTDLDGRALYFSRAPIPGVHSSHVVEPFLAIREQVLAHVGIYGYPLDILARLTALPPSPLEELESLEQLRALQHGVPIRVLEVAAAAPSVDTPEDLERVRPLLEEEARSREKS